MNDFLLYSKVRDGDISSYETLFRRFYEPLCLYSNKITGDLDVAEDIVQELFYLLWKNHNELRIVLSVKSYLYNAVRNNSLKYIEHLKVRLRHQKYMVKENNIYENCSPQNVLEYQELKQKIELVLEKLPKRRSDIFRMNRFDGKKYEQIAAEMSLSVKTIEAEMSKALKVLKKIV